MTWIARRRVEVISIGQQTDAHQQSHQLPEHVHEEGSVEEDPNPKIVEPAEQNMEDQFLFN